MSKHSIASGRLAKINHYQAQSLFRLRLISSRQNGTSLGHNYSSSNLTIGFAIWLGDFWHQNSCL